MSIKLLAFAAGLAVASAALAQPTQLDVANAWAGATPGKAENGAAYLTLESAIPDRLTGVSRNSSTPSPRPPTWVSSAATPRRNSS